MEECYICSETCSAKSKCNCKDRFVHDECLIKMINNSGKNRCPVCLENFNHFKVDYKTSTKCTTVGKVTCFAFVSFIFSISSICLMIYYYIISGSSNYIWIILSFLMILFLTLLLVAWGNFIKQENLRLLSRIRIHSTTIQDV